MDTPGSTRVGAIAPGTSGDPRAESSRIYLHPGKLFLAREVCLVTTILGSCVAVCLWDDVRRFGGINHFLLPAWAGGDQASSRFGNVAIEELIRELLGLGARRQQLRAKVFGGACVLEALQNGAHHLGQKNIDMAYRLLAEERIPVVGGDVGGKRGRKLMFRTDDGQAWVKLL